MTTTTFTLTADTIFNPEALDTFVHTTRRTLLTDPTTDPATLRALIQHRFDDHLVTSILNHPHATTDVIDALATAATGRWNLGNEGIMIIKDPRVSPAIAVEIVRCCRTHEAAFAAIERGDLTPELASNLRGMDNPDGIKMLLQHNLASEARLRRWASSHRSSTRRVIAAAPTAPTEILDRLGRDDVTDVRLAVARNSATSVERLRILTGDPAHAVATAARRNLTRRGAPLVDPDAGDNLDPSHPLFGYFFGQVEDRGVRIDTAMNPTTDVTLLRELAIDDDAAVRAAALRNPNLPMDIVDAALDVIEQAERAQRDTTITPPHYQQVQEARDTMFKVTANPTLGQERALRAIPLMRSGAPLAAELLDHITTLTPDVESVLVSRWRHSALPMRKLVTKAGVSEETYDLLMFAYQVSVRRAMAGSEHTPDHVLENLLRDDDERVVQRARKTLDARRAARPLAAQ